MNLTDAMLQPLVDGITSNMDVILPVGCTIMGILYGVKLIPRIIGYFAR